MSHLLMFDLLANIYLGDKFFRKFALIKSLLFQPIHPAMELVWLAAEDEGRTETPTERRRQKEREKGRVPKSQEIPSSLVSIGGLVTLFFLANWVISGLANIMTTYLGGISQLQTADSSKLGVLFISLFEKVAIIIAPILLVAMLMAIIGNILQVGFIFSLKPLEFDFSRIKLSFNNLAKRVFFSRQIAFNLIKTIIKVAVMGLLGIWIIQIDFLEVLKTTNMNLTDSLSLLGWLAFKLALVLSVVLLIVALPDYLYQRYEFTESIKMTKQEVKQEAKETEGDPLIKQRQRQRAMEFMRRNLFQSVKEADVIITNPTHYAIALRYDQSQEAAPKVLAKGEDQIALTIKNLARKKEIPIIENKPLARELYVRVKEGDEVPVEFYQVLATIFAQIKKMETNV